MPSYPASRAAFFRLAENRMQENVERIEGTGKASRKHLKVFWLEVNDRYGPRPRIADGWKRLERDFYLLMDHEEGVPLVWLDTSDDRVWYAYTFDERDKIRKKLGKTLLDQRGMDHAWLTESFLERIQEAEGYQSRGFGVRFENSLEENMGERGKFSAKFWTGRDLPPDHEQLIRRTSEVFSKNSVRMGRPSSDPDRDASGILLEAYSQGSMTVTSSEDPEETLGLVRKVGEWYSSELEELENRRESSPRPAELSFGQEVDVERFADMVQSGIGETKLWLRATEKENGFVRFTGTDLHTRELIDLDLASGYAYVGIEKGGCMNAAPRLMTVTAEWLTGKTDLYYDGARLFA